MIVYVIYYLHNIRPLEVVVWHYCSITVALHVYVSCLEYIMLQRSRYISIVEIFPT